MTDKLAEAISLKTVHDVMDETLEAASKYHALPVVDIEELKLKVHSYTAEWLRATDPNGLKWKV